MEKMKTDLSIFNEFDFEMKPVGVKFLLGKPLDIEQLNKEIAICEMLKEAQHTGKFYATKENFQCKAGPLLLGMEETDPVFESGQIGPKLGVYDDPRANRNIYHHIPTLAKNSVNYVAFASINEINFSPDLLIVTATPSQAEIILRAMSYDNGEIWESKGTPVVGCAWMYLYPYVSRKVNLMITGLYHGMKARNLFPEGLLFISIPYNWISTITNNLHKIKWYLPQYDRGKEAHIKNMERIVQELRSEIHN